MGKYMKKGKITSDVSVMEVSQHTAILGVRTRARNPRFAAKLRAVLPPAPQPAAREAPISNSIAPETEQLQQAKQPPEDKLEATGLKRASVGKDYERESEEIAEASFGENSLEIDGTERSTRESTPCSFVRGSDTIRTPGSAVGPSCSVVAGRRARTSIQRITPSAYEMEEFFAAAELLQQEQFLTKYNFDIVNDSPLSGRFEWVRLIP
ncbi:hypothetical protein Nepgr_022252 [Nepenthes gracilis]|uniref:Cyclin-dependent kinase inhibitor n=1 Tax=Nepenthes gracilis TaxID=150966 RepID=A0AAD3T0G2_NEPGR|nr:hypothetical protein Nepgr_022252 [Nepenthes gracilis]